MYFYSDSFHYYGTLHQSDRHLPYLLMFHGFMGSGRVFDHLIGNLSSFCNPITIDLAGHGKTESPADPKYYTSSRQVRQLKSIIQRLKFKNLWLYGYSMGGRLVFQLLASFPELFSGAVIESSHCGIEPESERSERQIADEKRAQKIGANFDRFLKEWMKLPLFQHTPPEHQAGYEEIMNQQNPEQLSASLRGFGAGVMPAVCDRLYNKCTLPVTLVAGELDQKYCSIMAGMDKRWKTAGLKIIKNAGHRVHTDQPGELVNCMRTAMYES